MPRARSSFDDGSVHATLNLVLAQRTPAAKAANNPASRNIVLLIRGVHCNGKADADRGKAIL